MDDTIVVILTIVIVIVLVNIALSIYTLKSLLKKKVEEPDNEEQNVLLGYLVGKDAVDNNIENKEERGVPIYVQTKVAYKGNRTKARITTGTTKLKPHKIE